MQNNLNQMNDNAITNINHNILFIY